MLNEKLSQRVYVESIILDTFVVDEKSGDLIGRPILTIAIEKETGRVLDFYISFDSSNQKELVFENGALRFTSSKEDSTKYLRDVKS